MVSELKHWQESERQQLVKQREPDRPIDTGNEQSRHNSMSGTSKTSLTSVKRTGNRPIPWQQPGFLGSFFYQSHEISEHLDAPDELDEAQGQRPPVSRVYIHTFILIFMSCSPPFASTVTSVADAKGLGFPCSPSAQRLDNSAQGLDHSSLRRRDISTY